jgi:hypothetical protein
MAADAFVFYPRNKDNMAIADLPAATVKMALLTSTYTPSVDPTTGHYLFADLTNELGTTNTGYTAGGATLGTTAVTAITSGFKYASADVVWTAGSANLPAFLYAVIYASGTLWGMASPLIGYIKCDSTGTQIPATTATNTLTIACPAGGWFDVT